MFLGGGGGLGVEMGVSQAGIIRMNLSVYLKFSIGFSPLPFPGAAVSPSPGARMVSALHCCPQQPAQSGPGTEPPSRRGRGEARVSQWLSAFPADSTDTPPSPPHTQPRPRTFHFIPTRGAAVPPPRVPRRHPGGRQQAPLGHRARWPGRLSLRTVRIGCNGLFGI